MKWLGVTEQELRAYVDMELDVYKHLDHPRSSFTWWIQVRLQCHRDRAERIVEWWLNLT